MNLAENNFVHPVNNESVVPPAEPRDFDLALSGGGIRATLYHLGMLVHLANTGRLERVKTIVSVSGGSITTGHFAKHWTRAISNREGFVDVSAELIRFTRTDLRHNVLLPWLWSKLWLLWFKRSWGRSARLEKAYRSHFESTTLGDLDQPNSPQLAIVATDSIRQERIAFTTKNIIRIPLDFNTTNAANRAPTFITATGVRLSLAVAASSCFPPVFNRMYLTCADLGLNYADFKETLRLNDGGVAGNLGVEVLLEMHKMQGRPPRLAIVSSAERPQTTQPLNTPLTDINAGSAAQSAGGIERVKGELGQNCTIIQFSERNPAPLGLPFRVETTLLKYRTDLDAPTWQEIHALMLHGATSTEYAFKETTNEIHAANQAVVRMILAKAGCVKQLPTPTENDLLSSDRRPWVRVVATLGIIIIIFAMVASSAYKWWTWQPSYPLDNLEAHISTLKKSTNEKTEEKYKQAMLGKIVTWKGMVEHSDGKKGRIFVVDGGAKYYVFVTFKDSTVLELNKVITVRGQVNESTAGGSYLIDAVVVP
ncbi:MAG: patatin-like phospholipase family protein [Gemmatales bacterium]